MAVTPCFRLVVEGEGARGQMLVCRFAYQRAGVLVFDEDGEDLIEAWRLAAEAAFLDTFSASNLINKYTVYGLTDPTYLYEEAIAEPRPVGTISGDSLPPQDAAVITWRTGMAGRSFRGRNYLWPAGETSQAAGRVTEGYINAMDAFAGEAIRIGDGVTTAHWNLVVWSGTLNEGNLVTTWTSRAVIRTQRKRVEGVGS